MSDAATAERPRQAKLPGFEAREVQGIEIAFSGKIVLNPDLASDVAFFKSLKYGTEVELTVTGTVAEVAYKGKKEEIDGEITGVQDPVNVRKLLIHSLEVPEG